MAKKNHLTSGEYDVPADRSLNFMERAKGIEPSSLGWKPKALPLSYARERSKVYRAGRQPDPLLVGMAGFEPTTSASQTPRATNLRHIPDTAN